MNSKVLLTLAVIGISFGVKSSCVKADRFGQGVNSFEIDFVEIGNAGNTPDTAGAPSPGGSVPYDFRMGTYEVSERMIESANALGGLGLSKINRSPNKPATGLSWFDAAKFVNWLNTSEGHSVAYKFDLSGNFQLWGPGDQGFDATNQYRNSFAKYFLPSANEWYKSAYFDPVKNKYNAAPFEIDLNSRVPDPASSEGDTSFDAVFFLGVSLAVPNDIYNVGRASPYGTYGQAGNVFELEETEYDLVNDSTFANQLRGVRGGGWQNSFFWAESFVRTNIPADVRTSEVLGFRVASKVIPEPVSMVICCVAFLLAVANSKRVS